MASGEIKTEKDKDKEILDAQKAFNDYWDKADKEEADKHKKTAEDQWQFDLDIGKKNFEQQKKAAAETVRLEEEKDKALLRGAKTFEEAKMNVANSAMNLLSAISGKSKALQKAAMIAERALAIAEIVMKARIANMATTAWGAAYAIPTFGASMALAVGINAKNKIAEILNIAAVIGATAMGLAGFARGGYTKSGLKYEPAGVVHAGEWVASQEMVNNRETGPIISALERKRTTLMGSGAMSRISHYGYAEGGYTSNSLPDIPYMGIDYDKLAEANRRYLEVTLNVNKLNSAQNELSVITTPQRI